MFGKRRPKTEDRGSNLSRSLLLCTCARVRVPAHVPRAHGREIRGGERGDKERSPVVGLRFPNPCVGVWKTKTEDRGTYNKGRKEGRREWIPLSRSLSSNLCTCTRFRSRLTCAHVHTAGRRGGKRGRERRDKE